MSLGPSIVPRSFILPSPIFSLPSFCSSSIVLSSSLFPPEGALPSSLLSFLVYRPSEAFVRRPSFFYSSLGLLIFPLPSSQPKALFLTSIFLFLVPRPSEAVIPRPSVFYSSLLSSILSFLVHRPSEAFVRRPSVSYSSLLSSIVHRPSAAVIQAKRSSIGSFIVPRPSVFHSSLSLLFVPQSLILPSCLSIVHRPSAAVIQAKRSSIGSFIVHRPSIF